MSNNCLVTKLKGVVDNNNMEKFGVYYLPIYQSTLESAPSLSFAFQAGENEFTIEALDGGYFHDANTSNPPITSITRNSMIWIEIPDQPDFRLAIKSKYDLTVLIATSPNTDSYLDRMRYRIDVSSYKYLTNLRAVRLFPLKGDANFIKEFPHIYDLTLREESLMDTQLQFNIDEGTFANAANINNIALSWSSGIVGNIVNLGNCISLTTLNLDASKITGNLEDFADAMVANGRTSGTLNVFAGYTSVKHNNETFVNKTITFTEEGYTIS